MLRYLLGIIAAITPSAVAMTHAEDTPWQEPLLEPTPMSSPLTPPPITANTYYVAHNGNDSSGDGSFRTPWRTIQYGIKQLYPGDGLFIREGTYKENHLQFDRSGTYGNYITVAAYPGDDVVIDGDGKSGDGFNIQQNYIVIRGLEIMNIQMYGVAIPADFHHIWIVDNEFHHIGLSKTYNYGNAIGGWGHHLVVSNNHIHSYGNTAGGVHRHSVFEFNIIHDIGRDADDAGAFKSFGYANIIRYNRIFNVYRSPYSKRPFWAPESKGGARWDGGKGVTAIYLDLGKDAQQGTHTYIYGNHLHNNNAGIYLWRSSNVYVFDNIIHDNGRSSQGSWLEGEENTEWRNFSMSFGRGIFACLSVDLKIYGNICYNNLKDGIGIYGLVPQNMKAIEGEGPIEIFDNICFNNGGNEIDLDIGDDKLYRVLSGYNRIISADDQPISYRKRYASYEQLREAAPYLDYNSIVLAGKPKDYINRNISALAYSQLPFDPEQWERAKAELLAGKVPDASELIKKLQSTQLPYCLPGEQGDPVPWPIPGLIEAEHYDTGGPEIAYYDTDFKNLGTAYREDGVDIKENENASNGHIVGWGATGEWLAYTVDVIRSKTYEVAIHYSSAADAPTVYLEINDLPVSDSIILPTTDTWDELAIYQISDIRLDEGTQSLKVVIENGYLDIDAFEFK